MQKIDLSRPHVGNRVTFGPMDVMAYDPGKNIVRVNIGGTDYDLPADCVGSITAPEARVGDIVRHKNNTVFDRCEVVAARDGRLIVFSESGTTTSGKPHEFELLERA